MCLSQPRVLYQRSGSLRVLRSILAVLSTALFWTESSDVVPGICWSHSSSLGVTAPSAPITTGTTLTFTFHILSCSSFCPWYFSGFSFFLMLLSQLEIAEVYTYTYIYLYIDIYRYLYIYIYLYIYRYIYIYIISNYNSTVFTVGLGAAWCLLPAPV